MTELTVDKFNNEDKNDFIKLWNIHDPWGIENGQDQIGPSNWNSLISNIKPLQAFTLRSNNKPVGFVLYHYNPCTKTIQDECFVREIFVNPKFRKMGGASKLLNAVIDKAKNDGVSRIRWVSNPNRKESASFYNKFNADKAEWSIYTMWLN